MHYPKGLGGEVKWVWRGSIWGESQGLWNHNASLPVLPPHKIDPAGTMEAVASVPLSPVFPIVLPSFSKWPQSWLSLLHAECGWPNLSYEEISYEEILIVKKRIISWECQHVELIWVFWMTIKIIWTIFFWLNTFFIYFYKRLFEPNWQHIPRRKISNAPKVFVLIASCYCLIALSLNLCWL